MEYKNYNFSWKNGSFVLKSKTPQEGYQEIEYLDQKTGKKAFTYHKYVKSVEGVVTKVDIKEFPFGKYFNLYLQTDENTVSSIQVPLKDKYTYSAEVQAFVSAMENLKEGERVTINPKITEFDRKNGKKGKSLSFWFNYDNIKGEDGKSLSSGYIPYNEIPKPIISEEFGETVFDNKPVTGFFYEKIEALKEKYQGIKQEETTQKPSTNKSNGMVPSIDFDTENHDDDLPF